MRAITTHPAMLLIIVADDCNVVSWNPGNMISSASSTLYQDLLYNALHIRSYCSLHTLQTVQHLVLLKFMTGAKPLLNS